MLNALHRRWQDDFWRHNAVLFGGTLAVGAVNYLYYPVLGRLLPVADFGEVQVVVSLFLQVGVLLAALNVVVVNISATQTARPARDDLLGELERLSLVGLGVVLLLGGLALPALQGFLHIDSPWPFVALLLAVLLSTPLVFRTAYLQGIKDFTGASLSGIAGAVTKLAASALLVIAGFGVTGAVAGLVVAQGLTFAVVYYRAKRRGYAPGLHLLRRRAPNLKLLAPQLRYGALVLSVTLVTTLLYSADILVVKHYFSAAEAGLYAGVAVVARSIFFLTASIGGVLLPSIKAANPPGLNRQVLSRSFALLGLIGGGAALLMSLAPGRLVALLVGAKYQPEAALLPPLAWAILLISAVNLGLYYFLALRRWSAAVIAGLGGAATLGLVAHSHGTMRAVIADMTWGSIIMLIMLMLWGLWLHQRGGTVGEA